ncbi:hypothetical protein GALL_244200 [mine drainage metagenome]|uniref:Uncharacterized protein n=1 Tax=mine drainage metagenome TaxID=410659 RepID=A0A1J5RZZ3_9ZZZZ
MGFSLRNWLRISFFNLLIVAFIGVILRYKIAFSLLFVNQKYLLHGHSHFAFSGWVTQVLMVLLVYHLSKYKEGAFKKYHWLLSGNLIAAYGMLLSFPVQGYGFVSICFSTLSIIISYFFAIKFWKDLNSLKIKRISFWWYKAALLFNTISSLGAFSLAFLMVNKTGNQNFYLAAVYFFLHFQYNGWFFFAGMGLLISQLENIVSFQKQLKIIFWLFGLACLPAYFLSALWLPIPFLIYCLVVIAAISQCVGWLFLIKIIIKNIDAVKTLFSQKGQWLLLLSAIALTIKLLLQLGSTIPSLSRLAFGFRPIVIGYLHLVLLGLTSIFIIGYIVSKNLLSVNKTFMKGIYVFVTGIIINEILLMIQGVAGMGYVGIPFINELLLFAAVIMFSGVLLMNWPNKSQV